MKIVCTSSMVVFRIGFASSITGQPYWDAPMLEDNVDL